jgi:hypothetical protein
LTIELPSGSVPVTRSLLGDLMKCLVEFPLGRGDSLLVEVDEPPEGPVVRGRGKDRSALAEKADKTFEDATAAVVPAASTPIARLRAAADPPDEIDIEFGVQLSAQTGRSSRRWRRRTSESR